MRRSAKTGSSAPGPSSWPSASTGRAAGASSASSWREFLLGLKQRGLRGVRLAISDDHAGLRRAVAEILPEAAWQRCYVHFLRNALDHLPRTADPACLIELRWLYDCRDPGEARLHLPTWLGRWAGKYPRLGAWVEENIEETWAFYRCPRAHHKDLKSTNLLERLNQELQRRTQVVRIFPHEQCCLRLIRAFAAEQHEEWLDGPVYLDMQPLRDQLKPALQLAA